MYYLARIIKKMKVVSKKNVDIDKTAKVEGGTQIINTKMNRYSFCGYDCQIINTKIGSFCSISSNVIIGAASHPLTWVSTSCAFYQGRDSIKKDLAQLIYAEKDPITVIDNDVWIGTNVIIKAGVHISDGAVIGMGAVLTKDVGPYEVWAGNPAKLIKKRFDDDTIESLLLSRWWTMQDAELLKHTYVFNDVNKFLSGVELK